ncbi:MAG: hypothetical protein ACK4WD_07855 [Flavobacteriales bacterium]|jgi:hypothetical protein
MKPSTGRAIVLGIAVSACCVLYLQMKPHQEKKHLYFHHGQMRGNGLDSLYEGENAMFASAGKCDHCHGADPNGLASVDFFGNDVNVVDDWSSSMMALSARDPYWRAKVSHEVAVNPGHQQELENLCTKCHAPMGNYASQSQGFDHYSIEQMVEDPVALDGVSCLACHRQTPQPEEALHTGQLFFDPLKIAYGPYTSPLITPMALSSNYTPEYGAHITQSELCAGCHSLITQTVDLEGNSTGSEFVEQATWHEWLNSAYPNEGVSCQSCHLPRLPKQSVILAAGYNTPAREPYGLHEMVGGNVLMLALMKENRSSLGIAATEAAFDETIAKTVDMLQNKSITTQITQEYRNADTLAFNLKITNLGGHKMPSGYPARRMSVFVTVRNDLDEVIFQSGGFNEDFSIMGENSDWEPHYQFIRSEDQVQIYEMVMGDVSGNRTTVLERGAIHLKDNRLVPRGFSTQHPQYDTTAVVLNMSDEDFIMNPGPNSGSDRIHYRVPLQGETSPLSVEVKVYYQSVPPNWVTDMFTYDTDPINAFEDMYAQADKSPVLMKSLAFELDEYVGIGENERSLVQMRYVPLQQQLSVKSQSGGEVRVFDHKGALVFSQKVSGGQQWLPMQLKASTYMAVLNGEVYRFVVQQ